MCSLSCDQVKLLAWSIRGRFGKSVNWLLPGEEKER